MATTGPEPSPKLNPNPYGGAPTKPGGPGGPNMKPWWLTATPAQRAAPWTQQARLPALCRQYTLTAVEALADIIDNSPSASARVAAIALMLERGWGKVPQQIDVGMAQSSWDVTKLSDGELELLTQLAQRALPGAAAEIMEENLEGEEPAQEGDIEEAPEPVMVEEVAAVKPPSPDETIVSPPVGKRRGRPPKPKPPRSGPPPRRGRPPGSGSRKKADETIVSSPQGE